MEIIPYIVILTLLTVLLTFARLNVRSIKSTKEIKILKYTPIGFLYIFISYILFIVFSIFRTINRGLGGADALAYKMIFEKAGGSLIHSINLQFYEPGYGLLIWFSRSLSNNYEFALFIIYTFMFILLINFIKYISWSKYVPISIFLLLTLWLSSFNTTRSILAMFIGTYVYTLLINERYKTAVFFSLIALSIHNSAIILFPIIIFVLFNNKRKSFKPFKLLLMTLFLTMGLVISYFALQNIILGGRYASYVDYKEGAIAVGTYFIILITFIISLTNYNALMKININNKIWIIILPTCLSLILLQVNLSIVYRMVLFYLPILYIFIPDLIQSIPLKGNKNLIKAPLKLGLGSYLVFRIFSFFNEEIVFIGVPYTNEMIDLISKSLFLN